MSIFCLFWLPFSDEETGQCYHGFEGLDNKNKDLITMDAVSDWMWVSMNVTKDYL